MVAQGPGAANAGLAAGGGLGWDASFFAYSASTIAGAVAMMPGGLGVTEAGMTGLIEALSGGAVEIATPPRRPRVLLVDDEPQLLRALRRSLRKDADVVCAESGDEAIAERERDGAYDLVITDLQMPSGSGADLYAWAEANAPTIAARMQFATGGAFTPDARALVERFPDRVIYKPFETLDLRRRIAESVL